MLGQRDNPINFQNVMDKGQHLLVNLGGINAPDTQRLIGALLVNGIYHAAKRRRTRRTRDWFLIVDEFGEYATRDFAMALDQLRKFGCHLILAHQHIAQLERQSPDVLPAVLTNCGIKVVFGGLARPDAERISHELFTGSHRGDEVKHVNYQTKFRPVSDTFEVETESWSDTHGAGESGSSSSTTNSGRTESSGQSFAGDDDAEDDAVTRNIQQGTSDTNSSSESHSGSTQHSSTSGGSRSVVPITRHEEFQEETGRTYWTLEEQREMRVVSLHGLSTREAFIRVFNRAPIQIRTLDVEPADDTRRFQRKVLECSPHARPADQIREEIESRRLELERLSHAGKNTSIKTNTFRE
jgi:hypothetical protein